jgi:hypothetical protein
MAYAATHILVPMLLVEVYRIVFKKKFSRWYTVFVGFAGLLPDIDFAVQWFMQWVFHIELDLHRYVSHSAIFILLFISWKSIS